jgi:alpha-1,2-glucosyltransferase
VRGHAAWSALLLLASMGVRQNHVLWGGLVAVACVWPTWGMPSRRRMLEAMLPLALVLLVFLAYWQWNGTISFSNVQAQRAHPDLILKAGNLYYALALFALLLPFHTAAGAWRFWRRARAQPAWLLLPLALAGLYATQFVVDHPYNGWRNDLMWRNWALQEIQSNPLIHALFGSLAVLAGCALCATPFTHRRWVWLLPLSALFLTSAWLIETRYTLVPIVLWLALSGPESPRIEYWTLALWLPLAAVIGFGVFSAWFMI